MPDDPAMGELAEKVEKLLYGIMNTMCYLINKICFAPNNTLPGGTDFDPEYAQQRLVTYLLQTNTVDNFDGDKEIKSSDLECFQIIDYICQFFQ